MNKTEAQRKAISEKYKEGTINKKKYPRYDTEGGKERKESDGYKLKTGKFAGKNKMSSDGDARVKKH